MAEMEFDTLHYARRLKDVGVPEQQVEPNLKVRS